MEKVYVFLADGCEEIEALTPVDLLRRAEIPVVTVSIMGRKEITGAHGIQIQADALFEEESFGDGTVFVCPGGMPGTAHLSACEPLMALLEKKQREGCRLAAICAAPALVLGQHGFLKDKKAICYPGMEAQLNCGEVVRKPVVTDGQITTSRGVGTAIEFALELIRLIQGADSAENIADQIVY
ncbi:MAG: DJ-1/PfpI family protein [Lachnospiraceae bacterium]|nr:DJ-1/PfpI family protein [Lachnospiraceae bacterium]